MSTPAPGLEVDGLTHAFGPRRVVDGVSLEVPRGEVHCLVGPSGCGKTTTLRLVAGLESIQAGRVAIGGRAVAAPGAEVPPERRRVGLMFQDFALFPHLRVADNVAFGLAGWPRAERAPRVAELLARVEMAPLARAYPYTLSGGEQQRVALARALAPRPDLMLLDEAFSALDASLRDAVRSETLAVLRGTGTPVLLVTHDADEAVRAGDRIHVMQAGRLVQSGTPAELYRAPASAFVAGFFGAVNRLRARVGPGGTVTLPGGGAPAPAGLDGGAAVEVVIRPEGVRLRPAGAGGTTSGAGGPLAAVRGERDLGPVRLVTVELPDGATLVARRDGRDPPLVPGGDRVALDLDPSHVFVYPVDA